MDKFSNYSKMKNETENIDSQQGNGILPCVSGSSLGEDLVEQRCKRVLEYLFPDCERQMSAKQYNNAMEALRSIAFGAPVGKNYR